MTPFTAPLDAGRRQWLRAADRVERFGRLPEQAERIADVEVGQTPSSVVYEENKLQLHQYEARTDEQYDVPILIVYALINRPYVLDLQPSRSVVRTLLEQGFDIYLVHWGEPSQLDTTLGLEDYVQRYIENCVDVVRERSGQDAINLLGYCMGGTMSAMYAALNPEKVRNLGLLAAGLCFDDTGGVLERWGDEDHFDPGDIVDTYGNVPASFLDVGFALMDPVENYLTKYVHLYDNLDDDDFVENFARMERWLDEGIDVAGAAYREFLEGMYQDNALARNEFYLGDERVDLGRIDMPVLQIVGEYDHLIPPAASVPFNDLVGSDDTEVIEFPTGHIGLSVSSRSHAELWPRVSEWFAERSGADGSTAVDEPTAVDAGTADNDVESVSGIGPAYAARLRDADVATVGDLAGATAEELAAETDISRARLADWIEQARSHLDEDDAETTGGGGA